MIITFSTLARQLFDAVTRGDYLQLQHLLNENGVLAKDIINQRPPRYYYLHQACQGQEKLTVLLRSRVSG